MRRSLALLAAMSLPLLAADEARKPNTLTPKEVADGWLLLFDGETTFGWKIDGEAKVEKGVMSLGGAKGANAQVGWLAGGSYRCEVNWEGEKAPSTEVGPLDFASQGKFITHDARASAGRPITFTIPAGTKLRLREVKLRPEGTFMRPLFNGKDLTGWKVFKGEPKREKSKWSVTKEGWLNVKDGPGDLQTEKQFDDFILQFDCISNGKHLNSGLFFRCQPDKYQVGYEAQIRNQFTEKPTQKYAVEEYDPKTNKLVGKKEVMSTAFDFGTGAIYRRVPARKGIAKDGEWFTMTVVARGRHIATWVNGMQVVDWTDNRPEGDNARNGYRAKAGAISIQGHDPTTDLSFRNLRVAPLPR